MRILITGGCGYLGSHIALLLLEAKHDVVLFDNLCNSSSTVVDRIATISDRRPKFLEGDVRDQPLVTQIMRRERIDAVLHLAALKSVPSSLATPTDYYSNNTCGTLTLAKSMLDAGVNRLIFSSTAAIYGEPRYLPIDEHHPTNPLTPYGASKMMCERILGDICASNPYWQVVSLRYFNPVGAHSSGLIGDSPEGKPENLMPYIARVAAGRYNTLNIFGGDYPTPDGTAVRDYIHVMDLAEGHIEALRFISAIRGFHYFNLGTGYGVSVKEMISAFAKTCGRPIPFQISGRREGDSAACYADPTAARIAFGWCAKRTLEDMCSSHWFWERNYNSSSS